MVWRRFSYFLEKTALCVLLKIYIQKNKDSDRYARTNKRRLYHDVSSIWDGGVNSPESYLINHEVDVRGSSPAVRESVVVSGTAQAALEQHTARVKTVLNLQGQVHKAHVSPLDPWIIWCCAPCQTDVDVHWCDNARLCLNELPGILHANFFNYQVQPRNKTVNTKHFPQVLTAGGRPIKTHTGD